MADRTDKRYGLLVSPGYLIGLSLLLINDFFLKAQFHNWLTGKLSDLSGLFIFPLFWAVLFPRFKRSIYIWTAFAFAFWKSGYSEPVIAAWNSLHLLPIGRTVDYTDLLGLIVLPFAYYYGRRSGNSSASRALLALITVLSLFAFTATQIARVEERYDNQYSFECSKPDLIKRMAGLHEIDYLGRPLQTASQSDDVEIHFDNCIETATIRVSGASNQSGVELIKISSRCSSSADKQMMLAFFEKEFIDKLKEAEPGRSRMIKEIWIMPKASPPSNNNGQPPPSNRRQRL